MRASVTVFVQRDSVMNERVRVWELTLQRGESSDAHRHDYDSFFYPIEGATLEGHSFIRMAKLAALLMKDGVSLFAVS